MVKMLKKIEACNAPLNVDDQNKINKLLKTYKNGKIEFYTSFSGLHGRNLEITTLEEMEVMLTSESLDDLEKLEKEFDSKIKENLGDKVRILNSNIINQK